MARFDFAISFAKPERPVARELAEALSRHGMRVFFDEYFEHEMLGRDGAEYLNRVFLKQSRYCVALLSEHYERRPWAQLERRAALAKEHASGPGTLLPVLVDSVKPDWLLPTRVYFNLAERPLRDLVGILRQKHAMEDPATFREVACVPLPTGDGPFAVAPGWDDGDFIVWCSMADEGTRQAVRLSRDPTVGRWIATDIPLTDRVGYLFVGSARSLVGVADMPKEGISIYREDEARITTIAPSRQYRWKGVTDCKANSGAILLAYCGGDVWLLDSAGHRLEELRAGSDEVQYTFCDFLGDEFVVALEEHDTLEIRRMSDGALARTLVSPVAAEGLICYPEADLIVVTGTNSLATLRLSSGAVVATQEIIGNGFSNPLHVQPTPIALVNGQEPGGGLLDVLNLDGERRAVRLHAAPSRGWSAAALSSSKEYLAVAAESEIVLHEGGK